MVIYYLKYKAEELDRLLFGGRGDRLGDCVRS